MLKRTIAVVAAAGLLAVPGVAIADPPAQPPGQTQRNGRLDLYEITTTPDVEAAMRDQGYDVVSSTPDGDGVHLEVVMSPAEANKARKAFGLEISLKRNPQGVPTVDAAFEEGNDGYEVWRTWSGDGGLADEMEFLAGQYDDLTQLITIGQTVQGQDIYAMRVTQKADTKREGQRPAVLYIANQHAREWITPEVNRRLLRYYLENYGSDATVTDIVNTTELWFVLSANPDGYDYSFEEGNRLWRKNLADNNGDGELSTIDGVDLNRNFATNWGYDDEGSSTNPTSQTYRGTAPASEPETQAMEGLMARLDFAFMMNYHSAAELILYGTGWQVDTPTPDDLPNIALAGDDANPAIPGYDPDLSAELYITNGDTTDHAGETHGIMAYTPELATCQTALGYPENTLPEDYCDGRSDFEFPDNEALVEAEFQKNLPFALSLAESAADPANPISALGTPSADFQVDAFPTSWGTSQEVAVWARREYKQLLMHSSVNGAKAKVSTPGEWAGGERYGADGRIWYSEFRGTVSGVSPGDSVEVWFTAMDTPSGGGAQKAVKLESEHFTYDVVNDGADVLIVSDNSPGTVLGGAAPLDYLDYYTSALDANGFTSDVYDVSALGAPHALSVMHHYDAVVWYTGDKLVTDYQGVAAGYNLTTLVAHEMNMAMRDYLNEGGKLLGTGANLGFEQFLPIAYGENGAPDQPCSTNCLVLTDDVFQYWLGAYSRTRRGGLGPDGAALDVQGTGGSFDGYTFGLDGGDSADNQGSPGAARTGTGSFIVTSSILDESEFPQFASERFGSWATDGAAPYEPVTGDWQMATNHDDVSYKRLATTVAVPEGSSATLDFSTSYGIEADWDYMFVEAHPVGTDDWTTLPDTNGHTSQATGESCLSGWADDLHPQLFHYQDAACNPTGTTGAWYATTGTSDGVEQWSIDLSSYAGQQVEVSISYATDWGTGDIGVFLDDVSVTVDGTMVSDTSFEDGLGDWAVIGAPEGSVANPNDWERVGVLFEIASIVATHDTLLFGFGFEGISTAAERIEVMGRSMQHLLGSP